MKLSTLLPLLLSCLCWAGFAQPAKLSFEVASIRPAVASQMGRGVSADAGMIRMEYVTLREIIRTAYGVKDWQMIGPDWLGNERFNVIAKFPSGATKDQIPEMLQSLLADRFKLVLHRESREDAVYALVVGKNGAKLKPAEAQTSGASDSGGPTASGVPQRDGMRMMMELSGVHAKATAATLTGLADALSRFTERPIVDMTGIAGKYDFDFVFSPEGTPRSVSEKAGLMQPPGGDHPPGVETANDQAPSIFDAIQRYGLKLEPRKAPLEVLTIDHIEKKPTEN